MGIFDSLKPKYRHSDHEKRLEGIEKLEDNAILLDMVLNDPEKEVRLAAFDKISFPGYFPLIAVRSHDADIRKMAFERIESCDDYAHVAKLSHEEHSKKRAINEISTVGVLENLKSDIHHSLHPHIDERIRELKRKK
jgi:hypothetical protein